LTDAHVHLFAVAQNKLQLSLSSAASIPDVLARLPSLVSYSIEPSSLTVSTGSGTVCQATSRMPAGMRGEADPGA
jgi:predicted amidohydrolase YtcJ